ncbi:hypothetical protein [Streptomyces sp. MAR4 CNX-425]|uniref:hypothetical protein n=1 Tax=Streptomyces sp. MAR4 CNX-425 TaxID=3406343 RepID=UPI003B503760
MPGAQELLARALADPTLLDDAAANPEEYADRYGLTPAEVRRFCGSGRPGVSLSADKTRAMKFLLADGAAPGTLALCRAVADEDEIFTRCLLPAKMSSPAGLISAITRLGELASRSAAAGDVPVIRDIVRYEVLPQEVRGNSVRPTTAPAVGPSLGADVRMAEFGCAVGQIRRRLIEKAAYEDLRERPTYYVVAHASVAPARVLVHRVSRDLYRLLSLCDGSLPVHALAERLGAHTESVERALARVRATGVDVAVARRA